VKKPTTSSNEKGMTPLKTHENSQKTLRIAQEHFNTLRRKGDKVKLLKVV